jgi:pimeloyl-[acyl-carrier protein] methyl ester esterase
MKLFCSVQGRGSRIVLLHGWGLHGGVFDDLAGRLAREHQVIVPDLPGHGRSAPGTFTLEHLSRAVLDFVSEPAVWLGWSLGGLIAMQAAIAWPQQVRQLVLVGATPRFVQHDDWVSAMRPDVFAEFGASLEHDYRATLLRFLSLQVGADEAGRTAVKQLRAGLFAHGEPDRKSLRAGLDFLNDTDLRSHLAKIAAPTLVIHGSHDRLAPPAAGAVLGDRIPGARYCEFRGAGHAPFLSQPQQFENTLREFLV